MSQSSIFDGLRAWQKVERNLVDLAACSPDKVQAMLSLHAYCHFSHRVALEEMARPPQRPLVFLSRAARW